MPSAQTLRLHTSQRSPRASSHWLAQSDRWLCKDVAPTVQLHGGVSLCWVLAETT
ncbi:hypothetical protein [Sphaerothrix gracilis]|uniref:hypothetical protein n=1 Tax=Sphaerothrix gracilis TaxID=3151835 RepID=UPI0031FE0C4C